MSRQFQYQDWAEPVQPEGDPNPAKWQGVFPSRIDRKTFPAAEQQFWTGPLSFEGNLTPDKWLGYHPDQIDRKQFLTCYQQAFAGPIQVIPLITMWLGSYPDMIQRKQFQTANLNMVLPGGSTPPPPPQEAKDIVGVHPCHSSHGSYKLVGIRT